MKRALVSFTLLFSTVAHAQTAPDEEPAEVLVQGQRFPTRERADPTPAAYVIEGDDLTVPGRSSADTLATAVGVQVTRRGGGADLATLSLRGSSNAQAPIYLAGIRLNDDLTGTVDLSTLPLFLLHRVEIYRGNAPTSVDELGFAGAVVLEPRLPARSIASRGPSVDARGALGLGSFGEGLARASLALGDQRAGASFAIGHHSATDDYTFVDDGGTRFDRSDDVVRRRVNADHRDLDVWAIGHVTKGPALLTTVVSAFDRDAGAPGLQLRGAEHARAHRRRWLAGVSASVGTPDDRWSLQTDMSVLTARYTLTDPQQELGFARLVDNDGNQNSERVRVSWRPLPALSMTLGASHSASRLALDADGSARERAHRDRLRPALSVLAEPVANLKISAVGDVSYQATRANHADQQLWIGAGRVGARYRVIDELALFGNVGRYARVPTLGELYGVTSGVLGNDELRAEQGWTVDAGAETELRTTHVEAFLQVVGYVRVADDLIGYRRSSLGVVRPYNLAAARMLGVEVSSGMSLWRTVFPAVSLTAIDPRDTSADRTTSSDLIPLQSRLVVTPRLEVRSPPWPLVQLDRASLGASLAYRSSRVADPAGLIVLAEQARLDIDMALAWAQHLTVRARMQNVADSQTFDVVGYPLPGRSVHGMLEVEL